MKKIIAIVISSLLLVGSTNLEVFAASSISGEFEGTVVTARVSINSSSATAVTSYARYCDEIQTIAKVSYWSGEVYYYSFETATSNAGGTSATATKKLGGAEVIGGEGRHAVICNGRQWGYKTTSVGINPTDAKQK